MNENQFFFELRCDALPKGWENQTIYTYEGPTADTLKHRLTITVDRHLPGKEPFIERCAEERTATVVKSLGGVEVVKKENLLLAERFACRHLQLKWCIAPKFIRELEYYFLINAERIVTFSCTYTEKSIKQLSGDVRNFIEYLLDGVNRPSEAIRQKGKG